MPIWLMSIQNGVSARVFERDASMDQRPRDWTLMLHWGLESLEAILPSDVLEKLPGAYCDPNYPEDYPSPLPVFHRGTGEILFHIPSTRMRLVSRQRLRAMLSHGLDIEYDKELVSIIEDTDKPVVLEFKDHTRVSANMVIGADGPKSAVRSHLLGEEKSRPVRTPWAFSWVSCTFHNTSQAQFVRAPHPVWHMSHGPGGVSGAAGMHHGFILLY
jgi:2-polyprenyl-6-methoxyphenol hydroxylase-like FAD-dependent oxidoreductase